MSSYLTSLSDAHSAGELKPPAPAVQRSSHGAPAATYEPALPTLRVDIPANAGHAVAPTSPQGRRGPLRSHPLSESAAPQGASPSGGASGAALARQPTLQSAQSVFGDAAGRSRFAPFLTHVHRQLDVPATLDLGAQALHTPRGGAADALGWYTQLSGTIGQARPAGKVANVLRQYEALVTLKDVLSSQVVDLLSPDAHADGYLELGYCGRLIRPLRDKSLHITGLKTAVHEQQSLADLAQVGGLGYDRYFGSRPNQAFVPLNSYAPLTEHVANDSLDLLVCPIGLHHCPPDKLDAFVASIAAVVRPGGSFIVREHDVGQPHVWDLATMAHAVFNAADGVPCDDEDKEVRNFQPVEGWVTLLQRHGFVCESAQGRVQAGDPTANTLLRFTRLPASDAPPPDQVAALERRMRLSCAHYTRAASQGHMTALEWHLVDTAREQADFGEVHGVHTYPFARQLGVLWRTFVGSARDAVRAGGWRSLPMEYVLMNLMMVVTTSAELLGKVLTMAPLRWLPQAMTRDAAALQTLQKQQRAYADFIVETPFFEFAYLRSIADLWRCVGRSTLRTLPVNLYVASVCSVEYLAKAALSAPLHAFYQGKDFGTIHAVVHDSAGQVRDDEIVKQRGAYKGIKLARYRPFTARLLQLLRSGVDVHAVAGQTHMPAKLHVPAGKEVPTAPGLRVLGEIPITGAAHGDRYVRVEVELRGLRALLPQFDASGVRVHYLHDF